MLNKIRPQVLALIATLAALATYALYSGNGDIAGMAVVAIAGALTKLVESD